MNRRPHPYQREIVSFSNLFALFICISALNIFFSCTFESQDFRLFRPHLWLVVWSNHWGVCFLDLTVYTNDVISPGLLPGRRRIFLPRTLGLFGAVFVRSLYFHALLFSFARLDLHKQSLSFSSHHNSSLLCDILLNKLNICPFRNLANQFGNKSADLHREPVGHLNLASKSRGA